jgi:hypothetical protein
MVDVTDGADIDMRLVALELLLRHFGLLLFVSLLVRFLGTCVGGPPARRTRAD